MKKVLIIIVVTITMIISILYIYNYNNYKYCSWHDGDVSTWQIHLDSKEAYALALNDNNQPVFKNPEQALKQLKKDYKHVISEARKQFDLPLILNKHTYKYYQNLAWQTVTDDVELQQQGNSVSYILDIYENSFKK